jgi:hypothetical protein
MSDSKHLPNGYQHRHGNIKVIELSEPEVRELWLMSTWYVDMLYDKHSLTDKSYVQTVETMLRRMVGLKWVDATKRMDDYWSQVINAHKSNNSKDETDTISNQE